MFPFFPFPADGGFECGIPFKKIKIIIIKIFFSSLFFFHVDIDCHFNNPILLLSLLKLLSLYHIKIFEKKIISLCIIVMISSVVSK